MLFAVNNYKYSCVQNLSDSPSFLSQVIVSKEQSKTWIASLFIALICLASAAAPVKAGDDFFQYHVGNVQLLHGWTHELGDRTRTVVSFQYAHGHKFGDTYAFLDLSNADTIYSEIHPRLSLSKISGQSFSFGPVKDILFATTFEFPEGTNRQLYGFAVDWNIPGFKFLKTNFYKRYNPDLTGSSEQVTIQWNLPFSISGESFLTDGFADLATAEGNRVGNEHVQIGLVWDVGRHFTKSNKLMLGTEYIHWNNKFGLLGVDESVAQLQLRLVL